MDDRSDMQVIMDQLNEVIGYLALLDQKPRKVIDYIIEAHFDRPTLERIVSDRMKEGWYLLGGATIGNRVVYQTKNIATMENEYTQAMVKYEDQSN